MNEALLQDRRILVVEDEYMIADDMQHALQKAGAIVLGPVPTVDEALDLLNQENGIDGAVLDVNLSGEKVFPVADVLASRNIRFLFATGYDAAEIPLAYRHIARCEKPVDAAAIARALRTELGAEQG